jgi:hypothetical protein
MNPGTSRLLEVRSLIKGGYPYALDDLPHWFWTGLAMIEFEIQDRQAKEIDSAKIESKIRRRNR